MQIEPLNHTLSWILSLQNGYPKNEIFFELHFCWVRIVSVPPPLDWCHVGNNHTLPLLGFIPSSKGLQSNVHLLTSKDCSILLDLLPPCTPIQGPPHTWAKGRDHVVTRALNSHPTAVPRALMALDSHMLCWNMHQAYLVEVGMMPSPIDHQTLSIVCHVEIHANFPSSMLVSLGP